MNGGADRIDTSYEELRTDIQKRLSTAKNKGEYVRKCNALLQKIAGSPDGEKFLGIYQNLKTLFYDFTPDLIMEKKKQIAEQKKITSEQRIPQIETIIGKEKAKLLFCNPEFKNTMLNLSYNQLNIIGKCIKHYEKSDESEDWIDAFFNIWLYLDNYSELLEDIGRSDDIDIAKLTKILQNENIFNIKCKDDLINFEQIKREQCDKWIQGNLDDKKKAVLYKIFEQSIEYTKTIIDKFGQDIKNIDDGNEKDYVRSLIEIMNLQDGDVLSEIYENVNEIELLDKALMQTNLRQAYSKKFNEGLLDTNNLKQIDSENLEEQLKGFDVYDAGTSFNILMTSIAPFYDNSPEDFYKDWNRAEIGLRYFCTNYIRNDMLGMVPIKHLAYGFNYMEENSLVSSGKEDIGARIPKSANLKYRLLNGSEEYLTPDTMINETEQYNDMQYKRIQCGERKQPSYIIAFRKNGNIENIDDIVKGAKDWKGKLPIVVVDIDKCIQSEKQKVDDMLVEYRLKPSKELARQIRQKVKNNRVANPEFCEEFQQELDLIENTENMPNIDEHNEDRTVKIEELAENYETVTALEREGATRQLYAQIRQRIKNKENEDFER